MTSDLLEKQDNLEGGEQVEVSVSGKDSFSGEVLKTFETGFKVVTEDDIEFIVNYITEIEDWILWTADDNAEYGFVKDPGNDTVDDWEVVDSD